MSLIKSDYLIIYINNVDKNNNKDSERDDTSNDLNVFIYIINVYSY